MKHALHSSERRSAPLACVALVALGLVSLEACQQKDLPKLPPAAGEGAPVATAIPTLKQLGERTPATQPQTAARAGTGSLQALHYAALGPKETGILTAITVEEGERVKRGQVVFRIDASQSLLMVDQAKAALATAKIQQASAQLDYDRTRSLRERGSVAEDALDQAKARVDALNSAVVQAQASLGLAQRHQTNMVVTSPIDGVVSEKRMNVGETATLMPPSVVLVIQNIDKLELRARLPETALKTVREGAKIDVRFPATGETRTVAIKRIAPTVDARTRTIEIVAEIDNPDHHLKAGMLTEVAYTETPAEKAETDATR